MPIKYVAVDSALGQNESDLKLLEDILEHKLLTDRHFLLLQFQNTNMKVKECLGSYADYETLALDNKKESMDIKGIFTHFSQFEKTPLQTINDKIQFGKKILYLDAVSNSFLRQFKANPECPGFWNLAVGTFCCHSCAYCFLNLTMRIRPLCVEHLNLSRLSNNLHYFTKKSAPHTVMFNAGESSDPLDNEPLLGIWNTIVELIHHSSNRLLCLTKSKNVYSVLKPDDNHLENCVIYSWSINPPEVVRRYEHHTASTDDRLAAARHIRNLGYRVRFRVDPILPLNLMESVTNGEDMSVMDIDLNDYYALLDTFTEIEPELVTFGTFRALPNLFNFITDKTFNKERFIMNGKRYRIPSQYRHYIYEKLGSYAQDLLHCPIAICKDPAIKLPFSTFKVPCQCMDLDHINK